MTPQPPLRRALALCLLLAAGSAAAQGTERQELEQLRATTLALIDALVQQGLLSRDKADTIVRQAQAARPAAAPAAAAAAAPASGWGTPLPGAQAAAPASGTIRVPYISQTLRDQIRDEIKAEVLAEARDGGWAAPNQLPDWVRGIRFEGDVRLRWQAERFDAPLYAVDANGVRLGDACTILGGNLPAECYRAQTEGPAWGPDLANTGTPRQRMTLRARFGATAKVSEDVSVGLRLSTGTSSPVSSSQTLGTNLVKSGIALDRGFLRWAPGSKVWLTAGRMANPFFGGELLWPDDLGFDGLAAQGEHIFPNGLVAFANAGVFPLEEFNLDRRDKWLLGLQVGTEWAIDQKLSFKAGLAVYDFARIEGVRETEPPPAGALAGALPYFSSQYPASVRQKGNTLIRLNDPASPTAAPTWGLASKFRPVSLSAAVTLRPWAAQPPQAPLELGLGLDWVKNTAFDLADIRTRAGTTALDGLLAKTTGLQIKATLARGRLAEAGDWQAFVAMRRLERDAWPDAFTDSTWHLGGTNHKGWQLGMSYAFDRRTTLGLKLSSTRNLDDGQRLPDGSSTLANAPLKIDLLQLDLSTRF